MICKCPKCGRFTTGKVDRILYAAIEGKKGYDEIVSKGSVAANSINKWSEKKLGKFIGKTIGTVGKGAVNIASAAVGNGRSFIHAASSLIDSDEYYCFQCSNGNCQHEWVEKKDTALDLTGLFYQMCLESFLKCTERRYLVINPDASVAYNNSNNTFMLTTVPLGIEMPEGSVNFGEIYISHPATPNRFYSIESYRMKVLEDELNDLKQFLLKLGASSISITGMTDKELMEYEKLSVSNKTKAGNQAIKAVIDAMAEREGQEYRRLRKKFQSKIKGKIQRFPLLDCKLFNTWQRLNPEWRRILELRKNGTTEYSFCIETESITNAKKMELEKVAASYSEFGSGVDNTYAKETISRLKESMRMSFNVDVVFHSLSKYQNPEIIND